MRAHRIDADADRYLLSMAVTLIEASEHALAAATRLLRSVPNADVRVVQALPLTERAAKPTESDVDGQGPSVDPSGGPGQLCEQVVENDW